MCVHPSPSVESGSRCTRAFPLCADVSLGGLVRAWHFMGPSSVTLELETREGPAAAALPLQQELRLRKTQISLEHTCLIRMRDTEWH